jgi:hypothetical protein
VWVGQTVQSHCKQHRKAAAPGDGDHVLAGAGNPTAAGACSHGRRSSATGDDNDDDDDDDDQLLANTLCLPHVPHAGPASEREALPYVRHGVSGEPRLH